MDILGLFAGFVTWQTPLSFLAGVGVHHLYCKYIRDREKPLYRTKKDGSYGFSSRFWTYTIIATIIIGWIGWRTQDTANRVQRQSQITTQFAELTNDCLQQVVDTLTTRVGYNDDIAQLDDRRQRAWEGLIFSLSAIQTNQTQAQRDEQAEPILDQFTAEIRAINADQARLASKREQNQYPNCAQIEPQR